MQYGEGQAVRWRVFSTEEEYHQYSGEYPVEMCHTISTKEARAQYGEGCAVRWRTSSKDLSHHQYGGGVQYRSVTSSVRTRVYSTGQP